MRRHISPLHNLTYGDLFNTKFHYDRCIVLHLKDEERQIWPHFQMQHSVLAPPGGTLPLKVFFWICRLNDGDIVSTNFAVQELAWRTKTSNYLAPGSLRRPRPTILDTVISLTFLISWIGFASGRLWNFRGNAHHAHRAVTETQF